MDSTSFLENTGHDRSNLNSQQIFEDALYYALEPQEREAVDQHQRKASESNSFLDAVSNPIQNIGSGTRDLTYNGLGVSSRRNLSWQITKQDSIMRDIPYFDKASSWKATRALTNGIDLNSKKVEADELNQITSDLNDFFNPLHSTLKLGDFYGGSGALIFVKGVETEKQYKQPLNIKEVKKDDFLGIKPLTRLYQIMPDLSGELITKVSDVDGVYGAEEIGEPKYFHVNLSGDREAKTKWFRVHRSRLLIYNSIELSWVEKRIEMYFGPTLLERSYSDFARYESMLAQINKLAQRSNIPILNIRNLPTASLQGQKFASFVTNRLKAINFGVSSGNMVLLGDSEREQFKYESADFKNLIDILKHYRENLSASLEGPTGMLFNDNVQEDEKKYLVKVKELQDRIVRRWFRKLIPLIYKSRFGKALKDYTFKFKSLEIVSEKEKAEKLKLVVELLSNLYEDNVIDTLSYQKMLKVAMENVSDIPHEITDQYISQLQKDANDGKLLNKMERDIDLAYTLNHIQGQDEKGNSHSNKAESALKGKMEGGDPDKKTKNKVKVPIKKEKKGE